jgi:histidyl-tRNA synthetase
MDKIGPQGVQTELESLGLTQSMVQEFFDFLKTPVVDPKIQKVIHMVSKQAKERYQIRFDPSLMRGMGYYTGQIFEIRDSALAGSSIAGGGRYDHMIGRILGQHVPACGFSIGFERIMTILQEREVRPLLVATSRKIALLYEEQDLEHVLDLAQTWREQGNLVAMIIKRKNIKQQLDEFVSQGFQAFGVFHANGQAVELKELKKI